ESEPAAKEPEAHAEPLPPSTDAEPPPDAAPIGDSEVRVEPARLEPVPYGSDVLIEEALPKLVTEIAPPEPIAEAAMESRDLPLQGNEADSPDEAAAGETAGEELAMEEGVMEETFSGEEIAAEEPPAESLEPARVPTSLTAALREQGGRY